ncbi:myb family transcription factor EFM-like [Actinidia eriantha]|uniref:myb family transcription factor EFM-like n=1 Tax=Actinidia eriantha TaxID=165200 RepID=UPI00258702B2|nr:myb family transcription factor EFM-like [Actinidia eriantha]
MRLDDFVKRLEDEMRRIDAFKRELPLCIILLNDAIVTLKEESTEYRVRNVEPVLEKFIPLKKNCNEDKESGIKEEEDRDTW